MGKRLLRSRLQKPRRSRECKYLCSCCGEEKPKPPVRAPFIRDVRHPKLKLKKRKCTLKGPQKPVLKSENALHSTVKIKPPTTSFSDKVGQNRTEVRVLCESAYVSVARLRKSILDSLSDNGTVCLSEEDSLSNLLKPEKSESKHFNEILGNTGTVSEESSSVMDRLRQLNASWLTSVKPNNQSKPSASSVSRTVPVVPLAGMKTTFLEDRKPSSDESFKENVKILRKDSGPDVIILDEPRNFQAPNHVTSPTTSDVRFIPFGHIVSHPTKPGTGQCQSKVGATVIRGALANRGHFRSLLKPRETVPTTVAASSAFNPLPVTVNRQSPRIMKSYNSVRAQPHAQTSEKGRCIVVKPKETPKLTPLNFNDPQPSDPLKNCEKSRMFDVIDVEPRERSGPRMTTQLPSSILKRKVNSELSCNHTSQTTGICPRKKILSPPGSSCIFKPAVSNRINGAVSKRNVIQSGRNVLTIVLSDSSDDECSLIVEKPGHIKLPAVGVARNPNVRGNVRYIPAVSPSAKKIVKDKTSESASKKKDSRSKSIKIGPKKNVKSGSTKTNKKAASKSCCVGCRIETPRRRKQSRGNATPDSDLSVVSESGDSDTDPDDPPYSSHGNVTSRRVHTSDPSTSSHERDSKESAKPLDATPSTSTPRRYQLRSSSTSKKRKATRKSKGGRKLKKLSSSQLSDAPRSAVHSSDEFVAGIVNAGKNEPLVTTEMNHVTQPVEDTTKCGDNPAKQNAEAASTIVSDEIRSGSMPPKMNAEGEDTDIIVEEAVDNPKRGKEVLDSDSVVNAPGNVEPQLADSENLEVVLLTSALSTLDKENTSLFRRPEKLTPPMSDRFEKWTTSEKGFQLLSTDQVSSQESKSRPPPKTMTFTEAFIASLYTTQGGSESEPAASDVSQHGPGVGTCSHSPGKRKFGERISDPKIEETLSSDGNQSLIIGPLIVSIADTSTQKTCTKSGSSHQQRDCSAIDGRSSGEGTIKGLRPPDIADSVRGSEFHNEPLTENSIDIESGDPHVPVTDTVDNCASRVTSISANGCNLKEIPSSPHSIVNAGNNCKFHENSKSGERTDVQEFPHELPQNSCTKAGSRCEPRENFSAVDVGGFQFPSEHHHISNVITNTESDLETSVPQSSDLLPDCSQVPVVSTADISDSQENSKPLGDSSNFHQFPPETIGSLLDFTENEVIFESHGNRVDQVCLESLKISHLENSYTAEVSASSEDHCSPVDDVSISQECHDVFANSAEKFCCSADAGTSSNRNCLICKKNDVGEGDLSISILNEDENVLPTSDDSCPKDPDIENCAIQKNRVPFSVHQDHNRAHESQQYDSEIEEILMSLDLCNTTSGTVLAQINPTLAYELQNDASLGNGDHAKSLKDSQSSHDVCVPADTVSNSRDVLLEERNVPLNESSFSLLGVGSLSLNGTSTLQANSGSSEKHGSEKDHPPCQSFLTSELSNISQDMVSPSPYEEAVVPSLQPSQDDLTCQLSTVNSMDQNHSGIGSPECSKTESEARCLASSRESDFDSDRWEALIQALKLYRQDLTIRKINPAYSGNAGLSSSEESGKICENDLLTTAHELNHSITFNPRLTVKKLPTFPGDNNSSDRTRAVYTLTSKNLDSTRSSVSLSPINKLNRREISILKFDELVIDNDEPSLNEPPEPDCVECVSLKGVRFDIRSDRASSIEDHLQSMLYVGSTADEWVIDNDEPPLNQTPIKKARSCLMERTENEEELEDLEIDNDMPPLNEPVDKAEDDCLIISSDDEIQKPSGSVVQSKPHAVTTAVPASRPVRKKLTKKRRKVFSSPLHNGSTDERMVFVNHIPNVGHSEERDPLSWFVNDMIDEVMDPLMVPADTLPSIQSSREVLCQPQVFNLQGQPLLKFEASSTKTAANSGVTPLNSINSSRVTFDLSHTLNHVQSPGSPESDPDVVILSPNSKITPYSNNSKNDCDSELVEDSDDDVILLTDNVPNCRRNRPNVERPVGNTSSSCVDLRPPPNSNLYLTSATPLEMRRVANSDGSSYCVLVIPNTHFSPNSRYPSLF